MEGVLNYGPAWTLALIVIIAIGFIWLYVKEKQ